MQTKLPSSVTASEDALVGDDDTFAMDEGFIIVITGVVAFVGVLWKLTSQTDSQLRRL